MSEQGSRNWLIAQDDGSDRATGGLPPLETRRWVARRWVARRWVARRKAQVVAAVRAGLLTLEDACERYNLSSEEFASWERAIDRHGVGALRVTRLQQFR